MFTVNLLNYRKETISILLTLIAHNVNNNEQDLYQSLVLIFKYC